MEIEQRYDYSASEPFIERFNKWEGEEPFLNDAAELYGELWQFKKDVQAWTFGLNRFKNYIFFRHKENKAATFVH